MVADPEVREAARRCIAFLSRSEYARRIGMMEDPEAPWGEFATAATGFAGLSLVEALAPGLIYLDPRATGRGARSRPPRSR
jgi:hypothetical protein